VVIGLFKEKKLSFNGNALPLHIRLHLEKLRKYNGRGYYECQLMNESEEIIKELNTLVYCLYDLLQLDNKWSQKRASLYSMQGEIGEYVRALETIRKKELDNIR